jgi:hypothetical protein
MVNVIFGNLELIVDAGDAYQLPELYLELGKLALLASDTTDAEGALRRAIELDAHQPMAKVWLAMTVLIQGGNADDEIQAVVDELNDPLWEEVDGIEAFGREDLTELARAEVAAYVDARPEHEASISELVNLIESTDT